MTAPPSQPSIPWRVMSAITMGTVGSLSRMFLYGLNRTETVGLERFLEVLDGRRDVGARERGLVTVSNHVCVMDDPLLWGVLPFKYAFNPGNHRWSLGSYDICFTNNFNILYFRPSSSYTPNSSLPVWWPLPTYHHASCPPPVISTIFSIPSRPQHDISVTVHNPFLPDIIDPFTSGSLSYTYSTNNTDIFPAPSAYQSRRFSWVHIFPEGRVHQHPAKTMRYFKWGVSRLILESEPLPAIIPIFIDGNQEIMHESRKWPRFVPRAGKTVKIAFGEELDGEEVFGELRNKWKRLVELQKKALAKKGMARDLAMGELTEGLKYGDEAVALRMEVTWLLRQEVSKVRQKLGYPDEDPKQGLVETWIEEGGKREGKMEDGSWVGDT